MSLPFLMDTSRGVISLPPAKGAMPVACGVSLRGGER